VNTLRELNNLIGYSLDVKFGLSASKKVFSICSGASRQIFIIYFIF
jgi:hypothetical protein